MTRFLLGLVTGLGVGYLFWGPTPIKDHVENLKEKIQDLVPTEQKDPESEATK